jgi:nucleotide-binding universal stress UspA family protein
MEAIAMKFLVPLDGSEFSEAILPRIASVIRALNAEIELATVVRSSAVHETPANYASRDPVPGGTMSGSRLNIPMLADLLPAPAESREQAVERLEAESSDYLAGLAARYPELAATTVVLFADDVAEAIIARARETGADLVAMTTHGRSGMSHLLAGSVAERVIRSGVAPVLVLRPPA